MYITKNDILFYHPDFKETNEKIQSLIIEAENTIDNLTYRRIHQIGFDNLSSFQKERVKAACCGQVIFLSVYGDWVSSPLKSYGINGVSMTLDESSVVKRNGVTVSAEAYSALLATGLLYRGF